MFVKYLKTDDDDADGERMGGHGSTGVVWYEW
jgi:dUTPase